MLKTTTKWKKLTTWWSWACSPQTLWCLTTDHHQPIRELCIRPSHTLDAPPSPGLYKCFAETLWGVWGFFENEPPVLLSWPYKKTFSAPNSNVLVCSASSYIGHTNLHSVTETSSCKRNNFWGLMYNMVSIVNITVVYLTIAKRVDFKSSHHKKKVTMWGDGYVS